ncbi:MAG: peptide chain release factor N(5)-glutamine methyltransferase [Lachnospiraceae bacterium]|nr:peptide chain release factor N(5)-glutamine methyltransferase [Lachnospiraceae bacterium]
MVIRKPESYRAAARVWTEALQQAGVPEAALQAERLLWHVCDMTPAAWLMRREEEISEAEWDEFSELAKRRLAREPLQYILGEQEFMGLPFTVTPDVLIPRQDTEHAVMEALACCEGKRVLDMCTGSGCIAVSIAKLGKPASVTGVDISEAALAVASANASRNDVAVSFVKSDMFSDVEGEFDVIVSNPPYIPPEQLAGLEPEVTDHEPRLALYGGEDGLLYYRVLVSEGAKHLRPAGDGETGGILIVEIGFDQGVSVPALFREAGFADVRVKKDYAGLDRVVIGHL